MANISNVVQTQRNQVCIYWLPVAIIIILYIIIIIHQIKEAGDISQHNMI